MLISEAFEWYRLKSLADDKSLNTIQIHHWAVDLLIRFLGDIEIKNVSEKSVVEFWVWIRTKYKPRRKAILSQSSQRNIWAGFRQFFLWAWQERHIDIRPDINVKCPKQSRRAISPLSKDEVEALFTACNRTRVAAAKGRSPFSMKRPTALRDSALIALLIETGVRVSECARLTVGDVNLETGRVFIAPHGSQHKTDSRYVYVGAAGRKMLIRYLASRGSLVKEDPLFASKDDSPMNRDSIRHVLVDLGEKAGLTGNVNPHRFRHTFALQYVRNGGDPHTLQMQGGWADMDAVAKYVDMASADSEERHRTASPLDNWKI